MLADVTRLLRPVGDSVPDPRLAQAARLDTLEDVLRWGGDVLEVIVQDEYTHDVVIQHHDAFLVFDTT